VADDPNTVLDDALLEVTVALETMSTGLQEGLKDLSDLNLRPESHNAVTDVVAQHGRRVILLTRARDAIQALLSDGYPKHDAHEVEQVIYDDLAEQQRTIGLAVAHFKPKERATALGLTAGTVQPKQ